MGGWWWLKGGNVHHVKREGNCPEEGNVRGICPGEMSGSPLRPMVSKIRLFVLPGGYHALHK